MRFLSTSTLVLGAAATVAIAAQNPMRPGRWETVMQMQMPNMPMAMPEMKHAQCITEAELAKDPATGLPRGMNSNDSCTVSDYKVDGSKVTWNVSCTGQMKMTGAGELLFKGDSFDGAIRMSMEQGEMTMKLAGKRVGDCTAP